MKAAIYNPYLDTLGGGERYTMAVARLLVKLGYTVDLQWSEETIINALSARFGMDLDGIKTVEEINRGDGYDVCFWVSDGSIPTLRARNNILHFQFPFYGVGGKTLINKMKLFRINSIVCNSEFTKRFIDHEYGVKSLVVYPPISMMKGSKEKENIILYVGRFSRLTQAKRQDVLIECFKKMYDKPDTDLRGWQLVLAGGAEVGVGSYIDELKNMAHGYPIKIVISPKYSELKGLYAKAKIYWSASGYGIDANTDPKRLEHFGMTVVEAMSAGCVPIVFDGGGHEEIVALDSGFLWNKKKELVSCTEKLIVSSALTKKMSRKAKRRSKEFNEERFESKFKLIL